MHSSTHSTEKGYEQVPVVQLVCQNTLRFLNHTLSSLVHDRSEEMYNLCDSGNWI